MSLINARFPLFVAGTRQPYPPEELSLNRVLQQGQSTSADDIEVHGLAQPMQLETWASPIFDEQGQLQYAINAFQDITRRKQMETELRQHRDQLEERVAERAAELVETNQNLQQEMAERRKVEAALLAVQGQLEQRVAERTAELEQANRQLTALLEILEQRMADRTRELTTFLDLTISTCLPRRPANLLKIMIPTGWPTAWPASRPLP